MELCPCGSEQPFGACCEPFIQGVQTAPTAEALMRSRYTAHVKTEIDYIHDTIHSSRREQFNRKESTAWSKRTEWISLEIVRTENGGPDDDEGIVEFVARYREKGKLCRHHEVAEFVKEEHKWFFLDGSAPQAAPTVRKGPKVGRNQPCPCGSGKKHKKCCGA
jgi:SEC-C motif domain protein